jgi:hypothetical protein
MIKAGVPERWTRGGKCEYRWQRGGPLGVPCDKRARWIVNGELRCGEHREDPQEASK